jgi:hypothetical protein
MPKYRKKPVVIEAVRFDSSDLNEISRFMGSIPQIHFNLKDEPSELKIKTLEGTMTANRGDWIIKGISGEFYPCKPDIFEKTYELVT